MPLQGIAAIEPTSTSNTCAPPPDLSLHISLPSSSLETQAPTDLSLSSNNFFTTHQPPPQYNNYNPTTTTSTTHFSNNMMSSPSSDVGGSLTPIKGIPVYHNHQRCFPFLPFEHHPKDLHLHHHHKMWLHHPNNNTTSSSWGYNHNHNHHTMGVSGLDNNPMWVLNNGSSLPASFKPHHHHNQFHHQYGVFGIGASHHHQGEDGTSSSSPGMNLMMRSRFMTKIPSKRSMRAPRMRWTTTLHARFVHAVQLLGGHESTLISFSQSHHSLSFFLIVITILYCLLFTSLVFIN